MSPTTPESEQRYSLKGIMSKWMRTRPDPGRTYKDEAKEKARKSAQRRVDDLVAIGLEAEPQYVELVKTLRPNLSGSK